MSSTYNLSLLSDLVAQWLAKSLRKQKIGCSNPTVDKNFHFVIIACFALLTAVVSPGKCRKPWHNLVNTLF